MSSYDEGFEEGAEMSRRLRDQALRQADKELARLRAEVEIERRAVERLAELAAEWFQPSDAEAAAAWARSKEVK